MEMAFIKHHTNLFPNLAPLLPVVPAKHGDPSAVAWDLVENQAERRGFARTVLPNKSHYAPTGNGKAYLIQG